MQNLLQTLDTLTNDELEAIIDRAEAILQERLAKVPLQEDPAIGMWADRNDMQDSAAWVRKLRQGRWPDHGKFTDICSIDALRGFGPGLDDIEDAEQHGTLHISITTEMELIIGYRNRGNRTAWNVSSGVVRFWP